MTGVPHELWGMSVPGHLGLWCGHTRTFHSSRTQVVWDAGRTLLLAAGADFRHKFMTARTLTFSPVMCMWLGGFSGHSDQAGHLCLPQEASSLWSTLLCRKVGAAQISGSMGLGCHTPGFSSMTILAPAWLLCINMCVHYKVLLSVPK